MFLDFLLDAISPGKIGATTDKAKKEKESRPIIVEFFAFISGLDARAIRPTKDACRYTLDNKEGLRAFHENPYVPISNNKSERVVKDFVIARKTRTPRKRKEACFLFLTLVRSARLNSLCPDAYIAWLLENMD